MKEKVFIAWSFEYGSISWTTPSNDSLTVTLNDVIDTISQNEEKLALVSAYVENDGKFYKRVERLTEDDIKFVMKLEQDPYITGGVDSEPYYTASATCGDFKYAIEWDILPDIDMGKQDDESIYCDWDEPRKIFAYTGSPDLDLDEIELLWD